MTLVLIALGILLVVVIVVGELMEKPEDLEQSRPPDEDDLED